ncbi:uncharacterized protein LOC115230328, partial [Octopus sinensis]|uniref:Uncharacterized protein LOC115230328 n=1 Tax=Octopus sinensis TaxID=2607531 RepID=A0A6P7U5Z0_9MOLL
LVVSLGKSFSGLISSFKIWNGISPNPLQTKNLVVGPLGTLAQGWTNLILGKSIKKLSPSYFNETICNYGFYDESCSSKLDKTKPKFTTCSQKDIFFVSKGSLAEGIPLPKPTGVGKITSSLNEDATYTWGVYSVIYVLKDNFDNYDTCRSKLYVQYGICEYQPSLDCSNTTQSCYPPCNSSLSFPQDNMVCGKLGTYDWRNPFVKQKFPSCGPRTEGLVNLTVNFQNVSDSSCDSSFEAELKTLIIKVTKNADKVWPGLCVDQSCSNINAVVDCQNDGKTANIVMTVKNVKAKLKDATTGTVEDTEQILKFMLRKIAVDKKVTVDTEKDYCKMGSERVGDLCIACTPGMFYHTRTEACHLCSLGFYQDQSEQTSCKSCPGGYTTMAKGSQSLNDCSVLSCPVGSSYNSSTQNCMECPKGFYQNKVGQTYCVPCPLGQDTPDVGAISESNCNKAVCQSGSQRINGKCELCPLGFFRRWYIDDKCIPCPRGTTTNVVGGKKLSDCTIPPCKPGEYLDIQTVTCTKCKAGTYQDRTNQMSCVPCPGGTWTKENGATSETDCKLYCKPGFYMSSDSKCLPCPRGFFKEQSGNTACTKCPQEDRTTAREGTVYSTDCSIVLCKPGHYLNTNEQKCYPCPVGSYKTTTNRDITCERCPKDRSTENTGSQSVADCSVVMCKAGTYITPSGCKECAKSYYQPKPKMTECIPCGVDKTTYETGATSKLQCLHVCPQGEALNYNTSLCTKCLSGYYGDRQTSQYCVKCPTGKTTIGTGEESPSKCIEIPDTMAQGESSSVTLYIKFRFHLPHCDTQRSQQLYEHLITDLVRDNLITLGKTWQGLCSNKCKSLQTRVKCIGTNTNQANAQDLKEPVDVIVVITDVKYTLFNIKDNITVLAASVIGQHCLKLSRYTLIEQNIIPVDACQVSLSCFCVDGQIPIYGKYICGDNCKPCPRGTYHNTSVSQCQMCPKDHYQDKTGSTKCKSCPSPFKTDNKGAQSRDECSDKRQMSLIIIVLSCIFGLLLLVLIVVGIYLSMRKGRQRSIMRRMKNRLTEPYTNPLFRNKYNTNKMESSRRVKWSEPENYSPHYVSPYFEAEHDFRR